MPAAGLSAKNRGFLVTLNRAFSGPFTPDDAAGAIGLDRPRASRLLRQLASRGWLKRLQRGLYSTVPLEAEDVEAWSADPWTIAARLFAPGYVAGYSALHHWDLTDQIFSTTAFVTTRPVPRRQRDVGSARFEIRHRPASALFGLRKVWRDGVPVQISDRERTLVDCLDDPSLGGGLRHVAEALEAYAQSEEVAWGRLIEYGERLGNRTVFKRLGYLTEALGLAGTDVSHALLTRISTGIGNLDPGLPDTGPIDSRWGLRLNSGVAR
jgi:predicted transcriptional regulator of viral defense system